MQSPRNLIGQTVGGRYQVTEILGQGGMSAVYKAYDPNLQRVVAIKTIHSHLAHDPKFVTRFQEEATAVAKLRHPNIVQVYDFNQDDGMYYMVQEFVPGETLQERLRRLNQVDRRMPLPEAIRYTIQLCNALEYAHQRGLIHRDIKPANIMLDVNGDAILMDFGIVKIVGGESHTATGAVVGTALYMAPEMIRGEAPGPRSDMYSLGITLFEMVSGKPPYEADSAMALMMMHINDPVPNLHNLRPEVPDDLIAVIEKSLAKAPVERFQSMAEMASALKLVLNRLQTGTIGSAILPGVGASNPAGVTLPDSNGSSRASGISQQATQPDSQPTRKIEHSASTVVINSATQYDRPQPQPAQSGSMYTPVYSTGDSQPGAAVLGGIPPAPSAGSRIKNKPVAVMIIAGLAIAMVAAVCGAFVILPKLVGLAETTQEAALVVGSGTTETPTLAATATFTPLPTDTPVLTPTDTPLPTDTPTPTISPTPTIPAGIPYSRINAITQDEQGNYLVEYETFEYTEALTGLHLMFNFDTQSNEMGYMYGGPRPFAKFSPKLRPATSGMICIHVANADHSIRPDSGNCMPLPDVVIAFANVDITCNLEPLAEAQEVSHVHAGQGALVRGISADESWWNVVDPHDTSQSCWIAVKDTQVSGDISKLPLINPPVLTPGADSGLSVAITAVTLDDQGRFVVAYTTQGFQEQLPGTHLHFFYNNVTQDEVGIEGEGKRLMFGGPSPFSGFTAADRPANATQICVVVANPDHSIIPNSGNCMDLPAGHSGHATQAPSNNQPKDNGGGGGYDY